MCAIVPMVLFSIGKRDNLVVRIPYCISSDDDRRIINSIKQLMMHHESIQMMTAFQIPTQVVQQA